MPEVSREAKTVFVGYACDKCEDGMMIVQPYYYPVSPPQYPHKCDKCGLEQTFSIQYPRIRYE